MGGERPLAEVTPENRNNHYRKAPNNVLSEGKSYQAILRTEKGDMTFQLYAKNAPMTVNNFVYLANQGFYDETTFHRVINDFMVQGGDPSGTGRGGPGYKFKDEFSPTLRFTKRGLLAMANAGPGTNGSQFFITHVPTPHLNNRHTIFGELIDGDDVLTAIRERDPMRDPNPGDKILRVDIIEK
ncbi:MAG: peptidylprolyl isomerase [Ardenticatenaceae bacterium]|nr:peptidylprolyl isomerase [Ardenticatenaceae bacterium]